MARYPFSVDDFPDSEYAAELRKPATTLPFPPAMEQDYLDDHLRRTEPRIRIWTAVAMFGIAARYGGEEFAIIVYDVSALAVDDIAEELRQAIENPNIANADSACSDYITVSIRVAVVQPALGRTPKGAMQPADEAFIPVQGGRAQPMLHRGAGRIRDAGDRLPSEAGRRETGSVAVQLQRPLPSASAPATTAAADTAWRSLDSSTTYTASGSGIFIFLRGARAGATVKAAARGSCRISTRVAIEHT